MWACLSAICGILSVERGALLRTRGALLRTRGYTVISEPVVPMEHVHDCAVLCHSTLEGHLADVEAAGCDPIEQMYRFNNICHRQRNRWDLLIPRETTTSWAALVDAMMAVATPIIREAQGPDFTDVVPLMSGAVISRPGARVQRFHVDATHAHFEAAQANPSIRMYSVFLPLVGIEEDADGTMFWPAESLGASSRALAKHMMDAPDSTLDPAALDAPATPAGGLVVFDYRTIHRGLANAREGGRERPVAYVACATGGASDDHNFPRTAVGNISLERARGLPFWNRGHAAQDRLDYYTEIEGDDSFGVPGAAMPRGHTASRAAPPRMLISSGQRHSEEAESCLEEERRVACEMHAEALARSEATYHRKQPSKQPQQQQPAFSAPWSSYSGTWDCYSFSGEDSGLGADGAPPAGFDEDELARVSRGPLLSATVCESIITEAEAADAWEESPRVAHYARHAGCLTPLSALSESLVLLRPFLTSRLFPAIQSVRRRGLKHAHRPPREDACVTLSRLVALVCLCLCFEGLSMWLWRGLAPRE